jgi:hypothetical protein
LKCSARKGCCCWWLYGGAWRVEEKKLLMYSINSCTCDPINQVGQWSEECLSSVSCIAMSSAAANSRCCAYGHTASNPISLLSLSAPSQCH